ncbi:MAG: sensor histidine kinase [Fimbriimonadaceae bacterium]
MQSRSQSRFAIWALGALAALSVGFSLWQGAVAVGIVFGALFVLAMIALSRSAAKIDQLEDAQARRGHEIDALTMQLEHQQEAIDALAEGLDVAVLLCDSSAKILYANPRFVEMFAISQPIRKTVLTATLSPELEEMVLQTAQDGEPRDIEIRVRGAGQRTAIARSWKESRSSERVYLSIYETTHLRKLERIRRDFVANVSHEFKTPMTLIRSMAEVLIDTGTEDPELQMRYLDQIVKEIDRISGLAQDLLTLSAAEAQEPDLELCNAAHLAKSTCEQMMAKARDRGLELSYEGPDELLAFLDPEAIRQVILNLLQNALTYTADGQVSCALFARGERLRIEVSDTGIGIPSVHLDRIFERFYRVDPARSRSSGGTGLGLSIVKHIVEQHGGTVEAQSSLGKGSKFIVEMPTGDVAAFLFEADPEEAGTAEETIVER